MHRMLSHVDRLVTNWRNVPKILVVEDCVLDGELMVHTLTQHGCEVLIRDNVPDAIELVRSVGHELDLIFLDLKLPPCLGIDVLAVSKQVCPQVPVIIVSGYATGELIAKALEIDCYVGIVNKPLTPIKTDQIFAAHKIMGAAGT